MKNHSGRWPIMEEHRDFIKQKGESLLKKFNYSIDDYIID
jgi:hypothetical protein